MGRTLRAANIARKKYRARASRVLYWAMTARIQPGVSAGSTNRKYRSEASATSTPAIPKTKPVLSGPDPLPCWPFIQGGYSIPCATLCDLCTLKSSLGDGLDRDRTSLEETIQPGEHDCAAEDRQEAGLLREDEPGQ